MTPAVLFLSVLVILLTGMVFLLSRRLQQRQSLRDELSAVSRQHIDLFQGGQLNEAAVESFKDRYRDLLERGEVEAVETSLRPGTQFVMQVRALAELGTDDAGRILEKQLQRRLTDDQIEQSWYWIDLASGLRSLNRSQSLPHLLRCAEAAGELPLGHYFAAETVCFLGFASYLRHPEASLGRAALRVLHRVLEGLRCGVQPQFVSEGRLGELVEELWDHRPANADPLVVRVFYEALRLLRRAPHAEVALAGEASEQEAFSWQMSRLAALEPALSDYLHEAPAQLCRALSQVAAPEQREMLLALSDLHADAAETVLPLLEQANSPNAELAVEVLTWSHNPRVGPFLRDWAARRVPMASRGQRRRQALPPRRSGLSSDIPYRAILLALRGHPSAQTETFLLLAMRDFEPGLRAAAVGSLGWWEPIHRAEVLLCLQQARRDLNADVRQAARAALARLGERQAMQWFRQGLTSEDVQRVHETIQLVAAENLTLLWPDLDRLADSEEIEVAQHAREATELLGEEMDRSKA
jgi:hypothetical protein